ncbi:CPBP family intramembrane glutamic endopeptidase [Haloimpatiens sp. FM7315]|uniref:CPBP family intramembrane glutamic endopeptidase n=1 Tax=Haloimpatiens sp. FM7315 TaxID=3298609 RepID=UPI0035A36F91
MVSNERGLFRETKNSKYLPNIFLSIILTLIFIIVGEIIGSLFSFGFIKFIKSQAVLFLIELVFSGVFTIILILLWVRFVEGLKVSSLGIKKDRCLKKYFIGFLIGFLMFSLVILILFLTGNIALNSKPNYVVGVAALSSVLIVLPGWAVQSATEEILTRGWLMNVIGARYNAALGLFVSSILFGLFHLFNNEISLLAIINICLVGIFFGLYVIKTEDLLGACGIHCAWNFVQGNVFGLEVSGNEINIGSIMDLNLKGNELFTGGQFGPEAGIATTIVLFIGIIILLLNIKKNK